MSGHNSSSSHSHNRSRTQPIPTQNDKLSTVIQDIITAINSFRGNNVIQDTISGMNRNSPRDNKEEAIQDIITAINSLRDVILATLSSPVSNTSSAAAAAAATTTTSSQEDEVQSTSYMETGLYKAAKKGNTTDFKKQVGQLGDAQVQVQVTSNNNTVLHVAAQFGNKPVVEQILNLYPLLLRRQNIKGEIPLHVAAREGHTHIVGELIKCAKRLYNQGASEDPERGFTIMEDIKEMLWMKNEDGDTALHEAVRNNHLHVVHLLLKEDPDSMHPSNYSAESPLYLAAEKGYHEILSLLIFHLCKSPSPAYGGPNGRTALHAAVFHGDKECIRKLLEWKPALKRKVDGYGWTPLHCAARVGTVSTVKLLLEEVDKSAAYIVDNDGKTALHVATSQGHLNIMKEIFSHCGDCWEKINTKSGQNILHVAVESEKRDVIQYILTKSWAKYLLNQKDVDGNTPLHLLATSDCYAPELIKYQNADKGAYNKKNMTPQDQATSIDHYRYYEKEITKRLKKYEAPEGWRNVVQKDREKIAKTKTDRAAQKRVIRVDFNRLCETHLVVAALIATVTFAAGFTMPGGYNNNDGPDQGTAILTKRFAFKAFVVTDAVAMVYSISAVLIYMITAFYDRRDKIHSRHFVGFCLINVAMGAMVLAFITGTYAVLQTTSGFLIAIFVCLTGSFAFFVYAVVLGKWVRDHFIYLLCRVEEICTKCHMRFVWENSEKMWKNSKKLWHWLVNKKAKHSGWDTSKYKRHDGEGS